MFLYLWAFVQTENIIFTLYKFLSSNDVTSLLTKLTRLIYRNPQFSTLYSRKSASTGASARFLDGGGGGGMIMGPTGSKRFNQRRVAAENISCGV